MRIDIINSFLQIKYLKKFIANKNPLIKGNPNNIAAPKPGVQGPEGEIIFNK